MASDGTVAARLLVEVGARGLNETAGGLARMDSAVRGSSQGIGGLVKAAGGLYAVKKGFDATIGSAISWESEFAGVEKTVEGTVGELASLESELLGMHRTMPVARADLAGIAEAAGALGIETESIGEFTTVVAQLGETTNVSVDQAATALGQLSNVIGLTETDFDNFGAALVELGNKGASTEADILGITSRAGAGAKLIGMAADETLAWSAAVANLGIESEAGGSALQRFFLGMTEHVATAGDELDAIAATAGVTSAEFTRAFGQDASAALQTFIGGMHDLTQAEQLALLEMLGFSDVRISRTLLGLAGDTENLTDALEVGAEGWADNTALVEEYGKRAATTASKIETLGNRLGDLGRRLGESQGGPVNLLLGAADASVSGWEKMFLDWELMFDSSVSSAVANMEDKGNFLRNNFLTEFFIGDEVRTEIRDNMLEWGTSIEETVMLMEQGITPAILEVERQQQRIRDAMTWEKADQGVDQPTVNPWASTFEALPEEVQEAMAKAREEAVAGMATILDNLNNSLRDGKDAYTQSWDDYLAGQEDPFTTAERNAFIAGQFAGTAFDDGLHSEDPEHVANTVEYVNSQLAEFDLLNPGALAIGKGVPANLQTGMEEIMPELEAYVKEKTGETLDNLSLEEAQQLGIDGIFAWWTGMQSQEVTATTTAKNIALRSKEAMAEPDWFGGGSAAAVAWANGLRSAADYAALMAWEVAAAADPFLHGKSPPPKGPLHTIDEGGYNVGKAWADGLARAGEYAGSKAGGLAGMADGALDIDSPTGIGAAGAGRSWAGVGAGREAFVVHTHIYLDSRQIAEAVDEHQQYERMPAGILPRS